MPSNDPWYTRTEFWFTLVTAVMGLMGAKVSSNPTVQAIGATIGGLSPIVYTWGRGNVKATQAAAAMTAVAQGMGVALPK